jgi:hypothetical protein
MEGSMPQDRLTPIQDAIFRGELITAIKLHREATGSGLKEAKEAVERLQAELRASSPEKFTSPPRRAGCFALVALLVALAVLAGVIRWGLG